MKPSKKEQEKDITVLEQSKKAPEITGSLFYSESDQAWSMIRFKKEILQKFPQLKEKRGSFCYKIAIYSSNEDLKKAIGSMKNDESVPLLLFLCRKMNEENESA
jgi:hypothetical protein